MLELKKTPEHTIDRVFLLALLALFAATAFLVVSIGAKQYIFPPTLKTSTSPHKISVVTNFKLWQYSVSSSIFMDTKLHNVYELLNFSPRKYLSLNAVYKYKSAVRIKSLFCADNERFTLLIQNKIKYPAIKKQHKYGQKRR